MITAPKTFAIPLAPLRAILQRVRRIAKLRPSAAASRGVIDCIAEGAAHGWAVRIADPARPLQVRLVVDGFPALESLAHESREDVAAAGLGTSRCGFRIRLPDGLQLKEGLHFTLFDADAGTLLARYVYPALDARQNAGETEAAPSPAVTGEAKASTPPSVGELQRVNAMFDDEGQAFNSSSAAEPDPVQITLPDGPGLGQGGHTAFDRFVGPIAVGWAVTATEEPAKQVLVSLGGKLLGHIQSDAHRSDVQATRELANPAVGYVAMLGGLLHFAAMSRGCHRMKIEQPGTPAACEVDLLEALPEALTFSPLKAFDRHLGGAPLGVLRGMRFLSDRDVSILFEAGTAAANAESALWIEIYQERTATPGVALQRLARLKIELNGQVVALNVGLLSPDSPILIVAVRSGSQIALTDCIPLPQLFAERHAPLIDYHGSLSSSSSVADVAAKISRNFIEFVVQGHRKTHAQMVGPTRHNTSVLVFTRDHADELPDVIDEAFAHVAAGPIAVLERDGTVRRAGEKRSLADHIASMGSAYVLLAEARTVLRPDFWAIFFKHSHRVTNDTRLVYWDSIFLDGAERPCLVKRRLLLDPAFHSHPLVETDSCIVSTECLRGAVAMNADGFCSGQLSLSHVFSMEADGDTVHLPVVMDSRRLDLLPSIEEKLRSDHVPIGTRAPCRLPARWSAGISVIINYRNSAKETIRCLDALRLQQFDGPLEIILVNNGSLAPCVRVVAEHATALFGGSSVVALDYAEPFNHSAQSNLGAAAAKHEVLLMLSNDAILVTPDALSQGRDILAVPWVATCGFRVVGQRNGRTRLQSMGLGISPRANLMQGGSPLVSHHPPAFALDCTVEVAGNSFAAAMIRRDMYASLGGLDATAFPVAYNDVDFCLRATAAGGRHIAIGSAIVDHLAHGSREVDLDLPIDARILDRLPSVATLTRFGFQSL